MKSRVRTKATKAESWSSKSEASSNIQESAHGMVFRLGGLDESATSCPKRFERVKMKHSHRTLVQKEQEMEDSIGLPVVIGFQMVELGKFKDTMKTDCSDP